MDDHCAAEQQYSMSVAPANEDAAAPVVYDEHMPPCSSCDRQQMQIQTQHPAVTAEDPPSQQAHDADSGEADVGSNVQTRGASIPPLQSVAATYLVPEISRDADSSLPLHHSLDLSSPPKDEALMPTSRARSEVAVSASPARDEASMPTTPRAAKAHMLCPALRVSPVKLELPRGPDRHSGVSAADGNSPGSGSTAASAGAAISRHRASQAEEEELDVPSDEESTGPRAPPIGAPRLPPSISFSSCAAHVDCSSTWDTPTSSRAVGSGKPVPAPGGAPQDPFVARSIKKVKTEPFNCERDKPGPSRRPSTVRSGLFSELEEEEEWVRRQKLTGAIARVVMYAGSVDITQDILGLRETATGRMLVTGVREGGAAAFNGVTEGDQLLAVNGLKNFSAYTPQSLHRSLRGPATLIFIGFVGKLQAEVRVKQPDQVHLGLAPETIMLHSSEFASGSVVRLYDAVVFKRPAQSVLLAIGSEKNSSYSDGSESTEVVWMYELHKHDAKRLVRRALFGPLEDEFDEEHHSV